jgi:hypothetical protein
LVAEGFLAGMEVTGEGYKKRLALGLRYAPSREAMLRANIPSSFQKARISRSSEG